MTEESLKMKVFFNYLWTTRPRRSEISDEYLGGEVKSIHFHHLFEKSTHPELAFCVENILIVTPYEHSNLNNNPDYYEEAIDKKKLVEDNMDEMIKQSKQLETRIKNVLNDGISYTE